MYLRFITIIIFFLGVLCRMVGQEEFRDRMPPEALLRSSQDSSLFFKGPDSTIIEFFYLSDIQKKIQFRDSTLDEFYQMYDPGRKMWREHYNLGNTGSSTLPILYNKQTLVGTNYGFNNYRPYQMTEDSFKYYKVNRPILNFYFTPVGGQQNFVIKTDFARNFSDGITLSINYNRIKQEGFYQEQDLKHTNLGMGIWYHHPKNKQDLFFHFINAVQSESQNGGVANRSELFAAFASNRISIPVTLDDASTRFQHHTYHLKNFYRLTDSIGNSQGIELISDLKLKRGYYKFSDRSVSNDEDYYGEFLVEDRGLRNYLGYTQVQIVQQIAGSLNFGLSGKVGIDYRFHNIDWEVFKERRNDLFLTAETDIVLGKRFIINGLGRFGIGSATGDLNILGKNRIELKQNYILNSSLEIYRHQHPLQAQQLYLNELLYWQNDFSNPFGTLFKTQLSLPIFNAKIGFEQSVENNLLYYNADRRPTIKEEVFTSSLVNIRFDLAYKSFKLENFFAFQTFNENVFHLPELFYKYNFHFTKDLFHRVLRLRVGMEGRVIGKHQGIDYFPLLSFFHQSENTQHTNTLLPYADFYLSAKVNSFRFFLRYENLGDLFDQRVYYQIGDYPQFDNMIRIGIGWYFLD